MATDFADLSHTPIFSQISSNPVLRNTSRRTLMPTPVRGAPPFYDVPDTRPPTNADLRCFQPLPRASTY